MVRNRVLNSCRYGLEHNSKAILRFRIRNRSFSDPEFRIKTKFSPNFNVVDLGPQGSRYGIEKKAGSGINIHKSKGKRKPQNSGSAENAGLAYLTFGIPVS
jgi:hypothetical protein